MKKYYRIMLGKGGMHTPDCLAGNFVGLDYKIHEDLTNELPDDWRTFNQRFIPVFLETHPEKTKIAAGLACGMLWTLAKGIQIGDIILCPDGTGHYNVGEVNGNYLYQSGEVLPHRRPVKWFGQTIDRKDMSQDLRHSSGSAGGVCDLTGYQAEIDHLISGIIEPHIIATDETIEDPSAFAMEKHLEDFLVHNWSHTELAKKYNIYKEEGEHTGQQYLTDTGPIDILAVSKDKKTLLVVELKKGRASDAVVGQLLRYMGYVKEVLAEETQTVRGVIIAMEDEPKIRRALSVVPNIDFYRYQISFKLIKV